MATITKFLKGAMTRPVKHIGSHLMQAENVLDFGAEGFKDVVASDVVKAIILPEQAVVTKLTLEVTTAEGSVVTCSVGDTDDVDGWEAAFDLYSQVLLYPGTETQTAKSGYDCSDGKHPGALLPEGELQYCVSSWS